MVDKKKNPMQIILTITATVIVIVLFILLYINTKTAYNQVVTSTIQSDDKTNLGTHSLNVYFVDEDRNLVDTKVYAQSFSTVEALKISAIELEYDMETYKSLESYYIEVNTSFPRGVYTEINNQSIHESNRYKVNLGVVDLTKITTGDYPIMVTLFYKENPQSEEKNATLIYQFNAVRG